MAKKTPLRKCVGCGEMIEKRDMLRVIRSKEGQIHLDPTGKANGRGAYLHNQKECLEKAIKSRGLERSLKLSVPPEIYEKLSKEMMDSETK